MNKLICAAASFLVLAGTAQAHCRVQCVQQVEQFVAVPYALPVGVPVASYGAVGYSYQPLNVNVTINSEAIADAVVARLTQPQQPGPLRAEGPTESQIKEMSKAVEAGGPTPPGWHSVDRAQMPGLPPPPVPVGPLTEYHATSCAQCHSPGGKGFSRIDLTNLAALTCDQRLSAARAVLGGAMPRGIKITDDARGNLVEELIGK